MSAEHPTPVPFPVRAASLPYDLAFAWMDASRTPRGDLPFETDDYGGWGGHAYHGTEEGVENTPVVFVHGNTRTADDFTAHADRLLEEGYTGDELWAITFSGLTPSHATMREELDAFVDGVLEDTGADEVDIVAHSLGVTGARSWLAEEDRYDDVRRFVGLAGGNHGSWATDVGPYCGLGYVTPDLTTTRSAAEGPLSELNEDETPGDVEWYTIYGGRDRFYRDTHSPRLEGATNVYLPDATHDAVLHGETTMDLLAEWLTQDDYVTTYE